MHYEVEVGGRTRQVTVAREGAGFAVTVDGHTRHIDVARIDAHTLSLILDSVWPRDAVVVASPGSDALTVGRERRVDPPWSSTAVVGRGTERRRVPGGRIASSRRCRARSFASLRRSGTSWPRSQPLVVVEAMKMENELRAGREGTVAEVRAREGQSVDAGTLLIVHSVNIINIQ